MQALSHTSYWQETSEDRARHYPALDQSIAVDVAIIGGGITGLTAARLLKESGLRVALLEANVIGGGTTGFTTAHLDATTDEPLDTMIANFGEAGARTAIAASRAAIDLIERWANEFGDCEFARVPSYAYTESKDGVRALQKQEAAARKLELPVSFEQVVPLPFACAGAVKISNQGRVHSLRYLHALAAEVQGGGSHIFEHTTAQPPKDGAPCVVSTPGGEVRAAHVFVATHSAFLGISQLDLRVFPYQSYVIAVRVEDDVPDALYWDDQDPYHYIRHATPADPDLLLIGGADHKTGHADDERRSFADLEQYAKQRFNVRAIEHRWSGEYFAPADGLPHIGLVPGTKHLYVATGYNGTGMTLGTAAGRIVTDLILGRENAAAELFRPGRLTVLASAKDFIVENLDAARHFVADRFSGERIESLNEIAAGKGEVITANGKQLAVYRDPYGQLYCLSPVCTHAGCIVHWNDAERTWDCPCHGGRFSCTGERIYGPPTADLEREEFPPRKA